MITHREDSTAAELAADLRKFAGDVSKIAKTTPDPKRSLTGLLLEAARRLEAA